MTGTLETVDYELEIRPCSGFWFHYEGRVVRRVQSSGASKPYREHFLPRDGWMRDRSRERLQRRLRGRLDKRTEEEVRRNVTHIPLEHTMAGWQ